MGRKEFYSLRLETLTCLESNDPLDPQSAATQSKTGANVSL